MRLRRGGGFGEPQRRTKARRGQQERAEPPRVALSQGAVVRAGR